MKNKYTIAGKFQFRPDSDNAMIIFIVLLAIFILGVQIGIKHGKDLQIQEYKEQYGDYFLSN